MAPGFSGRELTVIIFATEAPLPVEFEPFTEILPVFAFAPKLTRILFVVLVPVAPGGKVQRYDVAFSISGME
jgi:hypothetical protein